MSLLRVGLLLLLSAGEEKLPEGVLAIVDGKKITLQDYKDYLWKVHGTSELQNYIDMLLVEKKAKQLGITVTEEEVRNRVEEDVQRIVEGFYRGDVARWRQALADAGRTPEEYKAQRAFLARLNLLQRKIVLKARKVTEEKIRQRFERDYGKGGVKYILRHILISTRPRGRRTPDPEYEAKARTKAERILRELLDGADFEEMVRLYSDDVFTKKRGGRLLRYRPGLYGEEFDKAVQNLKKPGDISGIVRTRRGFHIIHLLGKEITKYEDVKEKIRKQLETEPPTTKEIIEFLKQLRSQAKIVR